MRKYVLFAATAFLSIFHSNSLYSQQSDWEKEQMRKSNVSKVISTIYYYNPGEAESSISSKLGSEFDHKGNLVQRIGYSTNGAPLMRWSYKYDKMNNMIESAVDGKVQSTATYIYDGKGHAVEASALNADGTVKERHTFVLNGMGKITEETIFDGNGVIQGKHQLKYDSKGNLIEYTELKADGRVDVRQTHTFNSYGNATQTVSYDSGGNVSGKTIYNYDADHLAEQIAYNGNGGIQARHIFKRDPKGFVVEEVELNAKGETVQRTTSAYEFYP